MIEIDIPGRKPLRLEHLVLDFNGTMACDGALCAGVAARLTSLAEKIQIHVLTADTFGSVRRELAGLPCEISVLPAGRQDRSKRDAVRRLGSRTVACIGNGRNDRLMLREAALSLVVILQEGAAVETLQAADIVLADITAALDLLDNPLRLAATLRS
jgi:soluble P-type ATPase